MERNSTSVDTMETSIILALTTIEEDTDESDNNQDEHQNIANSCYQQMGKKSCRSNMKQDGKKCMRLMFLRVVF